MNTSQNLHKPITPALRAFLADEAVRPLGFRRDGRPIFPIAGGAPDGDDNGDSNGGSGDGGQNSGQQGGDGGQSGSQGTGGTGGQGDGSQAGSGQHGDQAQDVKSLPDWAQKLITDTRTEAATHRTKKTEAETKYQSTLDAIGKALGLKDDDGNADPKVLGEQLTASQADARATKIENAVMRTAFKANVNPDRLTDSRSFMTKLEKLDPTDDNFAEQVKAAVDSAVEADPSLKTTPPPPPKSGGQVGGGGDSGGEKSVEDYVAEFNKTNK